MAKKRKKYDPTYRRLFSHPRMVEDLLRRYVAGAWVERMNFASLEPVRAHYVDGRTLEDREDDLVWRLKYGEGEDADWFYVYILLEFQSSVLRFMAIRVLGYLMLLYQSLLDAGVLTKSGKLPPVLPIVLYNGERPWTAPVQIGDLIEEIPGLGLIVPRFEYLVLDEAHLTAEELGPLDNPVTAVFQLEQSRGVEDVRRVVDALLEVLDDPELTALRRDFVTFLHEVIIPVRLGGQKVPEASSLQEVKSMLAERVIQWTQEWMAEGEQKGRQEGLREGKLSLLKDLLEKRFGPLPGWAVERLDRADVDSLDRWGQQIFDAKTLENVFMGA